MSSTKLAGSRLRGVPFAAATMAALIAAAIGCGRPAHQLETAPVRGKVTLDGEPVRSGYVVVPTARGRMASGEIQPDGAFVLSTYSQGDGVQVGTHPVAVNEVPPDEFSAVPHERRVSLPTRYMSAGTSGLTVHVKSGEDTFLELELRTAEPEESKN